MSCFLDPPPAAKLVQAIKSGKPQSEVIKEFDFQSATQFKSPYLDVLIKTGQAPENQDGAGIFKTGSFE